jgi:structural maintenance of chromosome 1
MHVAYEMEREGRYDAVALDGTFYQKSGIISGGSLDLARKAKRWDEKHMSQLKSNKEKLTDELREAMKQSRKESELNTVDSQRKGLKVRLRYAKSDRERTLTQINDLEKELKYLEKKLEESGPRIEEIEKQMRLRDQEIQEMKERMNSVEDDIFADFCRRIGMTNIRQYEERELRSQQERAKKRLEFENQKNRIMSQLDFERAKDTQNNVQRWERAVNDDEEELERAKQAEKKQMKEIEKDMAEVDRLKAAKLTKKSEVDSMEEHISKARKDVGQLAKEIQNVQKSVSSLEGKLEARKSERHSILKQCKMEDVAIPLLQGSLEEIAQDSGPGESMDGSGFTQTLYDRVSQLVVDYSSLSDHLKDLDDSDDVRKMDSKLTKVINDLSVTLQKIQAPNLRVRIRLIRDRVKVGF